MRTQHVLRAALASLAIGVAGLAVAQEGGERLETDRDSFTPATTTVAPGRWIVESAYSFLDNRNSAETHSFPELLVRRGVSDWLELRFGANFETGGESSTVSGNVGGSDRLRDEIETEAKVSYGVKAWLTDQDGWMPRSTVIFQGNTPTSGPETATQLVATYAWGWELCEGWRWDSGLRYANGSAEGDQFGLWAPSTVLKVELGERWTAHAEYFGIYTSEREEARSSSYFSPGMHCLVTPAVELGARVGWGVSDDAANFFSNVGVGVMF